MNKQIIAGFIAVAAIGVLGLFFPKAQNFVGAVPAGSTFNTAKFAGIVVSLANPGANGTSTSITNSDTSDRYVTAWKVGCEGVGTSKTAYTGTGLASLQLSIGTTSAAAPASFASDDAIITNQVIGTSTVNMASSSSAFQITAPLATLWRSGEKMTFYWNATNTAACTVGVDYLGS